MKYRSPRFSPWYSKMVSFDDGVDRAAFFAEAAEDALGQVDVVAGGAAEPSARTSDSMVIAIAPGTPPRTVCRRCSALRRFVAAQRVQAAEARRQRRFFRELHGDVAWDRNAPGQAMPLSNPEDEVLEKSRR